MIKAIRQEGYQLLQDGLIELARVERNGIRVDTALLEATKAKLGKQIRGLRVDLEGDEIWKKWRKRFGDKANLTSRAQLSAIFHVQLGYESVDKTESGEESTAEEALLKIDHPFILPYVRMMKYEKALGTFLKGIEKEIVGDRLHPSFMLHTARSMRGSSSDPNFQNFPVRDKEIAELIRSLFIPSPGCVIVENDFAGVEVSVSACYHKDPNFISYITTPGKDMHRDMAAQIYMMKSKEVSKDARYGAKNKFVFPQFYGDYYVACARNCWEWITKGKLTGPDGKTSLFEHLAENGITELGSSESVDGEIVPPKPGTFEHHMKEIENDFWNNRFMQYGQWRKDWYKAYLDKGYFDLYTGFRISGFYGRNAVTNYPVQGAAFHCLLWSLIQVNRLLRKYNMKSMVVGQIHDSLIGDVKINELRQYLEIVEHVTTVLLPKHYASWLIVPLKIEYEICPPNGTWFQKQEVSFKQGRFYHSENKERWTTDAAKFLQILKRN